MSANGIVVSLEKLVAGAATAITTVATWLFTRALNHRERITRLEATSEDHEQRIARIEEQQDGESQADHARVLDDGHRRRRTDRKEG